MSYITGIGPNSKVNKQFSPSTRTAADYQAGSWSRPRRVVCRVYHGPLGSDTRYIVTSFREADARYFYDTAYCRRGGAEFMIKETKHDL